MTRGRTPARKREYLYSVQNGKCYYCGNHVDFVPCVAEHRKPKSKGGGNGVTNKVMSCKPCDLIKLHIHTIKEAEEFIKKLAIFWSRVEKNNQLPYE